MLKRIRRSEDRSPAILSIHDVAPATLPNVQEILQWLHDRGAAPATLLVVPGVGWTDDDVALLRRLQQAGHELAGHGWSHACLRWGSLWHRFHGLAISRKLAEHLALPHEEIVPTILRCHRWFGEHGLDAPRLYVPPAWALGPVPVQAMQQLPFGLVETLAGARNTRTGVLVRMPLVGYEADTALRAVALKMLNAANRRIARWFRRPLRIAIHPNDLSLRCAGDLRRDMARGLGFASYAEACLDAAPRRP